MTTQPTPHFPPRRTTAAHPRPNPFRKAPMPIPLEGWCLLAADIFRESRLASHLAKNAPWLQARSRTSDEIEAALFPDYSLGGMEPEEVRSQLNYALFDAGYQPSDEESYNPTWTWTEAN